MLSSVSLTNSINTTALNTASLLAQVREARKASLATREINAVDPATNAVDPTYVKALYNAYDLFFNGNSSKVGLGTVEGLLKDQLNAVLSLVSSRRTYGFPLDIAKILDENKLTNACKKGNEAYKFYVRKIISELNNLHEVLTSAKNNLSQLQTLIRTGDFENLAVKELLTQLRLAELDGEAIKKTFSEYMVPKNFEITYFDIYWYNGKPAQTKTASTAKSALQTPEGYTMPEVTEIDWDDEKSKSKFPSRIPDDISSVDDLRSKIKTDKLTGSRKVYTLYYKKGSATELTDRYDSNAHVDYETKDDITDTEKSPLSFFGELTLLDKLKYIVLYYTKNGTRRTFRENDAINGFPCLPNPAVADSTNPATGQSRKYTDDVNEIARLEPFYIGFLVDRDGPVNALASFMEIKSAAISEQIKVLGYRIKALRHYLHFINRGLEEVNKSQSNGNARIPNSAYEILTMVGSNPTRCLKTIDGKDYFVLQWNGNEGKASYHTTDNNRYMLVPADDEGIEAFIKYADYPGLDYCYDRIFGSGNGAYSGSGWDAGQRLIRLGFLTQEKWNYKQEHNQKLENAGIWGYEVQNGQLALKYDYEWVYYDWKTRNVIEHPHGTEKVESCPLRIITETDESKLPRELETNRVNITGVTDKTFAENMKWNYYNSGSKYAKDIWPSVLHSFTTIYDTVIGNIQSQLESVNKSIESLRNKINTFDESAMNFRNKAFTIYNKTVNNIE